MLVVSFWWVVVNVGVDLIGWFMEYLWVLEVMCGVLLEWMLISLSVWFDWVCV